MSRLKKKLFYLSHNSHFEKNIKCNSTSQKATDKDIMLKIYIKCRTMSFYLQC